MNKTLYLMCGVPGSGKTTWCKNRIEGSNNAIYISRDNIRFSLLEDNDDYFGKEKMVFSIFLNSINNAILNDNIKEIYVDATHLNENSRNKILNAIRTDLVEIIPVNFQIPLKTCLDRNEKRTARSRVPESVIKRMYNTFNPASPNEKYQYKEIWSIKE